MQFDTVLYCVVLSQECCQYSLPGSECKMWFGAQVWTLVYLVLADVGQVIGVCGGGVGSGRGDGGVLHGARHVLYPPCVATSTLFGDEQVGAVGYVQRRLYRAAMWSAARNLEIWPADPEVRLASLRSRTCRSSSCGMMLTRTQFAIEVRC